MDQNMLAQVGIDYDEGCHRFNNKKELYEKFLLRFPQDQSYSQLVAALESKDVEKSFQAAHAMKGVTGNLSIQNLHKALIPLVEELRIGSMEHSEEYFETVKTGYAEVIKVLEEQA